MSADFWKYIARRPRYRVADAAAASVLVQRDSIQQPARVEAQLTDLCREGLQLRLPLPLEVDETISIALAHTRSELDLSAHAEVRWVRQESGDVWLAGCQMLCPLEWASLGELFLAGVLEQEVT